MIDEQQRPVLQRIRCTVCKAFLCDVIGLQIDPAIEFRSIHVHWKMLCTNKQCKSRKDKNPKDDRGVIVSVEFVMPEKTSAVGNVVMPNDKSFGCTCKASHHAPSCRLYNGT